MLVSDYFEQLSYGLFSNLSLSNEGSGEIVEAQRNKLIGYMNTGLQELHTRFVLREREALIEQHAHITHYHLDKRYAKENPTRPSTNVPYILDLPAEPFEDDALRILNVFDEYGKDRLNTVPEDPWAVFTPYPTMVQVTMPEQGRPLSVIYAANHRKLEFGVYNAEVHLPRVLQPALNLLVAAGVYSSMNTVEATNKSIELRNQYERLASDIEVKGTTGIDTPPQIQTFYLRGFR